MLDFTKYENKAPYPSDKYHQEERRIREEFKRDALKDTGFADHPRADKIFDYCWDRGHANGYSEVHSELDDLFYVLMG
jgi:hypothetical protein